MIINDVKDVETIAHATGTLTQHFLQLSSYRPVCATILIVQLICPEIRLPSIPRSPTE